MIKISMFYSWQSDLPNSTNRGFIEDLLKYSIIEVQKKIPNISICLDQGPKNRSGSRNIAEIILEKIEECDIFVCDISTVNSNEILARKMPNPNVMIEYGYALKSIGESRIISFFNSSFGSFPADLPFDLSHRSHAVYCLAKNDPSKPRVKKDLGKWIINALEIMLEEIRKEYVLYGLDEDSSSILIRACEVAIESNQRHVDLDCLSDLQFNEEELDSLLDEIEHHGYIKRHRSLNSNRMPFAVSKEGILAFAKLFIENFDNLVDKVADLIVSENVFSSQTLSEIVGQSSILVDAILETFQDKDLIFLSEELSPFHKVGCVRPRLRRLVSRK